MNDSDDHIQTTRLRRLSEVWQDVRYQPSPRLTAANWDRRRWVALTCSRLGNDTRLHAEICRFLSRSMLDCRNRGDVVVVAEQSAVAPWAIRAAELFGVDLIRVTVEPPHDTADVPRLGLTSDSATMSRDAAVITLADRVDAVYVRKGGTICRCLAARVSASGNASTRVAVTTAKKSAARELIALGAIGWFVHCERDDQYATPIKESDESARRINLDPAWMRSDGQWLVHCTRTCVGPWPGQTQHQYEDALLLGAQPLQPRTPLHTLKQILRRGILVANAIASAKAWPVVCFSAAPLRELLDRRCFRPHLKRWDYEPYGIAIRKRLAQRLGVQPVIYTDPADRHQFTPADRYRIQAIGKTFDWRSEREWRFPADIDLNQLDVGDVRIFVPTVKEATIMAEQTVFPVDVATLPSKSQGHPVVQSDAAV